MGPCMGCKPLQPSNIPLEAVYSHSQSSYIPERRCIAIHNQATFFSRGFMVIRKLQAIGMLLDGSSQTPKSRTSICMCRLVLIIVG